MFLPSKVSAAALVVLLGSTSGIWLVATVVAPRVTQAYTARVNVAIDRQGDESYEALLRRAELVARAAAQRSFDRDILINDVSIIIIAQSEGAEVPILTLDVSRQQWRSRPDPKRWATYYKTARTLLGLDNVTAPGTFPSQPLPVSPQSFPRPISLPRAVPTPQTPLPPGTGAPVRSPATPASGQPTTAPTVRPGTNPPGTNPPGTNPPGTNPPGTITPTPGQSSPSPNVDPEDEEEEF